MIGHPTSATEADMLVAPRRGGGRLGAAGLVAIGGAVGCFLLTALLGPSLFQPALDGRPGEPPYALDAGASPYLVVGLVAGGVLAGAAGLAACFAALRRGWSMRARPLLVAGLLVMAAFTFLPPIGSSDHLNYAAYGRMVVLGHDPYTTGSTDVPHDPVVGATEEWRRTPSVYGPLTTAAQAAASWAGGTSVRLTVFGLSVLNGAAFAATALILHRRASGARGRLRAALFWTVNPLVLLQLVAGAHNDVWAVALMIGSVAVFHGRPTVRKAVLSGVLAGLGAAVKLPAGLAAAGPAWTALRGRRPGVLAALSGSAVAVAALLYALAGPNVLAQAGRASEMVSFATPWHLVDVHVTGDRDVIKIAAALLTVVLALLLFRGLPRTADVPRDDPRRVAAAVVLAWLVAAPYVLPWYDGYAWVLLALLPASRFDWLLLLHTTALSLAYLPARGPRVIGLPENLSWLPETVRPLIVPWILTAILLTVPLLCLPLRTPRRPPAPGRPTD
ncbi:hypothetical protein [Actinomadura flavalba]|uniref:hypothetical protein n=1 Tax=Actinomadura flavalba TaxID=1120938 RepID=UPI000687875F|nr:hypothetical protein [Actinomadura flavalba]